MKENSWEMRRRESRKRKTCSGGVKTAIFSVPTYSTSLNFLNDRPYLPDGVYVRGSVIFKVKVNKWVYYMYVKFIYV